MTVVIVLLKSGGAATYVDPHDTQAMANEMKKILDNPDFRQSLIQKGYDYLDSIKDYNSVKMTRALYDF